MKTLTLLRDDTGDTGTFSRGSLVDANGVNLGEWDWIELPWRDNETGKSCIPPGVYSAVLVQSPHFGRQVYQLTNVPGRSAVEIHPANFAGDTSLGYRSDLRGCAAPGMLRGSLLASPGDERQQKAVLQSERAFQAFMDAAKGDYNIEVQTEWAAGLP